MLSLDDLIAITFYRDLDVIQEVETEIEELKEGDR